MTGDVYCHELTIMLQRLQGFRPELADRKAPLLLYDNARPLRPYEAPKILEELGMNLIPRGAYSADISPTDYHFSRLSKYMSTRRRTERCKDKNVFHPIALISTNQTHSKDKMMTVDDQQKEVEMDN
ncbi:hypothetical protein M514_05260 [Trichuris suis]|uniref:Tc1-like transposase DDE domain-containing protein n=1 Tax=Trichuris suis TaxID=68888 RepID=A0A085NIN8_9BILA|nr:hypothetical protein M514_05260 [Trichuris suis]